MSITDELAITIKATPIEDVEYYAQQERMNSGSETTIATVSQLHAMRSIDDAIILSANVFENMKQYENIEAILEAGYKLRVFAEEFEKLARKEIIPKIPKAGIEIGGIVIKEKNLPRKYKFQEGGKYLRLLSELEQAQKNVKDFEQMMKSASEDFADLETGEIISPAKQIETGTTTIIEWSKK